MKAGLLALLGLLPSAAFAQAAFPCPKATIGWALTWPGPLTSASYDSGTSILYIVWYGTIPQAFANVPIGIMQALSYTQQPSQIYYSSIVPNYHQILLSEKDNCPLSWEFGGAPQGYIWTN